MGSKYLFFLISRNIFCCHHHHCHLHHPHNISHPCYRESSSTVTFIIFTSMMLQGVFNCDNPWSHSLPSPSNHAHLLHKPFLQGFQIITIAASSSLVGWLENKDITMIIGWCFYGLPFLQGFQIITIASLVGVLMDGYQVSE